MDDDEREQLFASFAAHMAAAQRQAEQPVSVEEIATLDDSDLDDRIWMRLSTIIAYRDAAGLRAEDPLVSAYLATRTFEWEVGNGGLHQYFFNFDDPDLLAVVLDGYSTLGLHHARRDLEEIVAPIAAAEAAWRASLRDGNLQTFADSYDVTQLPEFDERIGLHDAERVQMVRANASTFAR